MLKILKYGKRYMKVFTAASKTNSKELKIENDLNVVKSREVLN